MYSLINQYADLIISKIDKQHIKDYDWLTENLKAINVSDNDNYRRRYSTFWRLSGAGLDDNFKKAYLSHLEENKNNLEIDVIDVCKFLYLIPANKKGKHTLQFSFATKLVHMINPLMPIYDNMIKDFFHLPDSSLKKNIRDRLSDCMAVYKFLVEEYKRIIKDNMLSNPINSFRNKLKPSHFTDQKIIDSLIWQYVSFAKNGSVLRREIVYS